ncbi:hypothetical protein H9Q74_014484, partial [Fusarium xylarioides]
EYSLDYPSTPKKDISRPWKKRLDDEQLETLRRWLHEHPLRREVNWRDFQSVIPGFCDIGIDAINTGMDFLGFERRYPGKKPRTDPSIRAERLEMCREALRLFPDPVDWVNGCIAFSDEKTFYNTKSGRRPVTIHQDEDVSDFRFIRRSGYGINHWGVFCGRWKGPNFVFGFDIPNNAYNYCVGPLEHANSFLHQVKQLTSCHDVYFQQDNSSVHTADYTKTYMQEHFPHRLLPWSRYSPDLNPIENLWPIMEMWIDDHYDTDSLNRQQQKEAIDAAWEAIDEDFLVKLSLSTRDRFLRCIREGGFPLDY